MNKVIIGIDPSSKSMHACATEADGKPQMFHVTLHKTDKTIANAQAYNWATELVGRFPLDEVFVFVELPVMGRAGAWTMLVIGKAIGAVEAAAVNAGAKVLEVNNSTWKSKVIGGKVDKPKIKLWVKDNWPAAFELADGNQDLCDAACINVHGQKVLGLVNKNVGPRKVIRRKKK